ERRDPCPHGLVLLRNGSLVSCVLQRMEVRDNPQQHRYELVDDDAVVGWLDYVEKQGRLYLTHAEVLPHLRGQGYGERLGEGLRSDVDRSVHGWASFMGRPMVWSAWSELIHSVRTGENAFRHVHGADVWAYRSAHPVELDAFDYAMTSVTAIVEPAVLEAYDFGRFAHVVDVAGGRGGLL